MYKTVLSYLNLFQLHKCASDKYLSFSSEEPPSQPCTHYSHSYFFIDVSYPPCMLLTLSLGPFCFLSFVSSITFFCLLSPTVFPSSSLLACIPRQQVMLAIPTSLQLLVCRKQVHGNCFLKTVPRNMLLKWKLCLLLYCLEKSVSRCPFTCIISFRV